MEWVGERDPERGAGQQFGFRRDPELGLGILEERVELVSRILVSERINDFPPGLSVPWLEDVREDSVEQAEELAGGPGLVDVFQPGDAAVRPRDTKEVVPQPAPIPATLGPHYGRTIVQDELLDTGPVGLNLALGNRDRPNLEHGGELLSALTIVALRAVCAGGESAGERLQDNAGAVGVDPPRYCVPLFPPLLLVRALDLDAPQNTRFNPRWNEDADISLLEPGVEPKVQQAGRDTRFCHARQLVIERDALAQPGRLGEQNSVPVEGEGRIGLLLYQVPELLLVLILRR